MIDVNNPRAVQNSRYSFGVGFGVSYGVSYLPLWNQSLFFKRMCYLQYTKHKCLLIYSLTLTRLFSEVCPSVHLIVKKREKERKKNSTTFDKMKKSR